MCKTPSAPDTSAQTENQIRAQSDTAAAQLAQQKAISDQQAAFNQEQLAYQQRQAEETQRQVDEQANRQGLWDTQRNALAQQGADAISKAFASFTPEYFQGYVKSQTDQSDAEIQRQAGLTQKGLTEKLAGQGILHSSEAANQQGLLQEDVGRQTTDFNNKAIDSSQTLQQQIAGQKNSLLAQLLSSSTLGAPIASGNPASLTSNINQATSNVAGLTTQAGDFATAVKPSSPLSIPANLFGAAGSSLGSYLSGAQSGRIASMYSGGAAGGGGPFASSALR